MTDHHPLLKATKVHDGRMCSREDRLLKNAYWWLVDLSGGVAQIGWGDLGTDELERLASAMRDDQVLLLLHEGKGANLTSTAPAISTLCERAGYAIVAGELRVVDAHGEANRLGYVWRQKGRRYASTGRVYSTGKVRLRAITPSDLEEAVADVLVGDEEHCDELARLAVSGSLA